MTSLDESLVVALHSAASDPHSVGFKGPSVDVVGSFHVVVHKIGERAGAGEVRFLKLCDSYMERADGAQFAQQESAFVSIGARGGETLTNTPRCHLGRSVVPGGLAGSGLIVLCLCTIS